MVSPRDRRRGCIASFDERAGIGEAYDGLSRWFFHCTAIADGSRTIIEGAAVDFALTPGHLGRWEASDIRPV